MPDHSTFSKNRHGRFRESEAFRFVFEQILKRCVAGGLIGGEGFAVDAGVVTADASRPKRHEDDDDDWGGGSRAIADEESPDRTTLAWPHEARKHRSMSGNNKGANVASRATTALAVYRLPFVIGSLDLLVGLQEHFAPYVVAAIPVLLAPWFCYLSLHKNSGSMHYLDRHR